LCFDHPVVIRASATRQIDNLLADLAAHETVRRETAVARLIVIGPRAVERLTRFVAASSSPAAKIAGLRALEGIADARALEIAVKARSFASFSRPNAVWRPWSASRK
jgi:hypothetical protein